MRYARISILATLAALTGCHGCDKNPGDSYGEPSGVGASEIESIKKATRNTLVPFASQGELEGFVKELIEARKKDSVRRRSATASAAGEGAIAEPMAAAPAADVAKESSTTSKPTESITNTQTAGVDEGGIVKVHGEHLVVLRRGRLFSVKVGERLEKTGQADAFGPNVDPNGAWYDEMLIAGDLIVVVGYSYQRGGTELGVFSIDGAGAIAHKGTYHLRSNDYYSSRNYASRLVGDKLVFYTPLYLQLDAANPMRGFPAVRTWKPGATEADFKTILEPTQVYRPLTPSPALALHTVSVCDLSKAGDSLPCTARAVLGPPGRVFYVSQDSVYVWMTDYHPPAPEDAGTKDTEPRSLLYRLPLGVGQVDTAPSVLKVRGAPIDQFSFLERDGHLNVLVSGQSGGDAMWASDRQALALAMLRVPLASFTRTGAAAPDASYTQLPKTDFGALQNRFVGDYLLYGTGASWGYPPKEPSGTLMAFPYAKPQAEPTTLQVGHGIERLEAMGDDAVAIGNQGSSLVFSSVALRRANEPPQLGGKYTRSGASQGETRSHGFFYKPEDAEHGTFGLPIREAGAGGAAQLTQGSAKLLFVKNDALTFHELGALASHPATGRDGCRASCVDWYGNARPIFLRGRMFALLGYELVEGKLGQNEVNEVQRLDFSPADVPLRAP